MFFPNTTLLLSILAAASAASLSGKSTRKLVSKSRALDENGYNLWMTNYSVRFDSCHTVMQYGGAEEQQNDAEDGSGPVAYASLVKYRLCSSDTCDTAKSCDGPEYIISLAEFVATYVQAKEEEKEQACQSVAENCYCADDVDDEACQTQCYADAGLTDCEDDQQNQNNGDDGNDFEFNMEEFLECAAIEDQNNNNNGNNNNNNNVQYSVGPYCADSGKSIKLGVFSDETCQTKASDEIFASAYGITLPYSESTIIDGGCVSCKQQDDDNNGNNNNGNNAEVSESCEALYMDSGKCEENVSVISYPNTQACTYMHSVLPSFEQLEANGYVHKSGKTAQVFAWIWFIATCGLAYYIHDLTNNSSKTVELSKQEGGNIA
eukprot:CAMPEP_0113318658 /NCGR_PEP_ID=MMETSP0010_2-20120614/13144_1 /TAXON_ID=216773 ORGANISM="Corethron hystrix, Strain 308" /NCGR_SAMPLE_ID=MMETSP0010_2 /ASSEMBLY_ACC=CAM_ASM_000155 /LENGTH=376 /DNA_ID=CAMNT_0000176015 /DNA_START=86 /DNA_END=1216 /DNA_ORIENTATION=- /assembly_acc=CAM_ASM_000155